MSVNSQNPPQAAKYYPNAFVDPMPSAPLVPLGDEITAAAKRYVVAHGGADVLEALGLEVA